MEYHCDHCHGRIDLDAAETVTDGANVFCCGQCAYHHGERPSQSPYVVIGRTDNWRGELCGCADALEAREALRRFRAVGIVCKISERV